MTALDELQRTLARAVDTGAAADPAAVRSAATNGSQASAGIPAAATRGRVAGPVRPRPLRRRRGWHVFAAILLAGGATTGALAATGNLPILKEQEAPYMPMVPDAGAGVRDTPVKILPLRVADPFGGPPWVIRTFTTNRKAGCAEAGQLYRGRFGVVSQDDHGRPVFQLVGVHIGETARCTNAVHDGFPVLRGLRSVFQWRETLGTDGKPCGADAPGGLGGPHSEAARPCPISKVRVMRFGLLGKAARSARFVRADGTRGRPLMLAPESGGAYLFVDELDPEPFRVADDIAWRSNGAFDGLRGMSSKPYDEMTAAERRRNAAAMRSRMRAASRVSSSLASRRAYRATQARDGVDATFADGSTFRVAGRGVVNRRLPGVGPVQDQLPKSLKAPITATFLGRNHAIEVSFPAPVALARFARHYRVTVRGPLAPTCHLLDSQSAYVMRAPKAGAVVTTKLRRLQRPSVGFMPWCPGKRYTVRVVHHTGTSPGGVDRPVGTTSFVAR